MTDLQQMNEALRPVAPPRVLDGVYSDDQFERIVGVIQREGPWPTITAHHFDTVEELVATSSGPMRDGELGSLTLDDVSTAHFRGYFGKNSVSFHPELDDCFFHSGFMDLARDYWGAQYAKPTHALFNLCGPHHSGLSAHLDAVTFRGVRIENSPVWLQNVMGKSGLFTEYLVKMGQVITWWYRGPEGTFTYWADGPLQPPSRLEHPLWNKGVVVQNEMMFHRGDPVGAWDSAPIRNMKHLSEMGYDADADAWNIYTDSEAVHTYRPEDMRLLVHWNAEVYADMTEVRKVMDHTDDITIEEAIGRLIADMRSKGTKVTEPSDPLHDTDFIRSVVETYTIAPTTEWLQIPAA